MAAEQLPKWLFGEHLTIWCLAVVLDIRWPKIAFSAAEQLAEFSVDVQCIRVTCGKYYFAHSQPLAHVCTENQDTH